MEGIAKGWWVVCHYSSPGNVIGLSNAFTNNVGKQISGSPSVGAGGGRSSFVLPSSPVTNPQTPGGGEIVRSVAWRVGGRGLARQAGN